MNLAPRRERERAMCGSGIRGVVDRTLLGRTTGSFAGRRGVRSRAIAEVRTQEAPWLELVALIELCERDRATPQDRSALAALVDQLPEASDTMAVAKARALIDTTKRT